MRISDWSSDVCSSDLAGRLAHGVEIPGQAQDADRPVGPRSAACALPGLPFRARTRRLQRGPQHHIGGIEIAPRERERIGGEALHRRIFVGWRRCEIAALRSDRLALRSEEHTSELQSLMRISYAVFCLKKKKI